MTGHETDLPWISFLAALPILGAVVVTLLPRSEKAALPKQVAFGVSEQIARVFQGMLLFFVLACDTFIFYRVRLVRRRRAATLPEIVQASHGNA